MINMHIHQRFSYKSTVTLLFTLQVGCFAELNISLNYSLDRWRLDNRLETNSWELCDSIKLFIPWGPNETIDFHPHVYLYTHSHCGAENTTWEGMGLSFVSLSISLSLCPSLLLSISLSVAQQSIFPTSGFPSPISVFLSHTLVFSPSGLPQIFPLASCSCEFWYIATWEFFFFFNVYFNGRVFLKIKKGFTKYIDPIVERGVLKQTYSCNISLDPWHLLGVVFQMWGFLCFYI